jgi:hypothetical protein
MAMNLSSGAERRVSSDAVTFATQALRDAKRAGAFDTVASAMFLSIAAIVKCERGSEALDDLLDLCRD